MWSRGAVPSRKCLARHGVSNARADSHCPSAVLVVMLEVMVVMLEVMLEDDAGGDAGDAGGDGGDAGGDAGG